MKPRLYEQNEMRFTDGGLCALHDAVFCEVTEELNGAFELKMKYPVSGEAFSMLKTGRIILAKPNVFEKAEPFHIYAVSKPLMGLVTVYAEHISYHTNKIVCAPFSASNIAEAILMLQHSAVNENPFTISTNMTVVKDIHSNVPITMRHGIIGRIVSLYGGEVKCEGWNIKILGMRGEDRGFSIRYGNNLVDLKQDEDISGIYDGVYPYYNVEKTVETDAIYVELPEKVILLGTHSERIKPLNLTSEFVEEPTEEELRAKTLEYLTKNDINAGVLTIEVEFALLSQTEEYRDISALEDVRLGDVVSVFVPQRGITVKSRCVKTVYDVMTNRYVKVTIGDIGKDITYSFISYEDRLMNSETKIGEQGKTIAGLSVTTSAMRAEINGIAEWIGNENGGIVKTIAALEATADANAAAIELNAKKIEANGEVIAALRVDSDEHTALISGYAEQITAHTKAIADTKEYVNELNATVSAVTKWIGDETKGAVKTITEVYQVSNENTAAITSITRWQDGINDSVARLIQETDENGARISMIVKSDEFGDYVDGSVLVEAINGESTAKIKADRIVLDGYATFTDVVEIAESVTAKKVISQSNDGNQVVSIAWGQMTMEQYYGGKTYTALQTAAYFHSHNPIAGLGFMSGNVAGVAAAAVGWSDSHNIYFTSGNAKLNGTWIGTSSAAITSDAGKKHDIIDLDDRYSAFFDAVRPVVYRYNDGTSGRFHTGFIANEVEAALASAGISTQEFAGFVNAEMIGENGDMETVKCLRYEEFIAVLWREVQRLKSILSL